MRKPLTARQQEIYAFIVEEIRQRGIPPTIREIGQRFGMRSSNGAREALNAIARKGYIRRHDRLSRGIELIDPVGGPNQPLAGRHVPLIRHLPPDSPQINQAAVSRYIVVDAWLLPPEGSPFAVVVPDDALGTSGLRAGDVVIAVAGAPHGNGDLVVAFAGSRLLVRRYCTDSSVAHLESDCGDELRLGTGQSRPEVVLVGHVCGLLRSFVKDIA